MHGPFHTEFAGRRCPICRVPVCATTRGMPHARQAGLGSRWMCVMRAGRARGVWIARLFASPLHSIGHESIPILAQAPSGKRRMILHPLSAASVLWMRPSAGKLSIARQERQSPLPKWAMSVTYCRMPRGRRLSARRESATGWGPSGPSKRAGREAGSALTGNAAASTVRADGAEARDE